MLTLGVLDEEEDVLVNVQLQDHENAERNVKLKRGKSDYCPYDEDDEMDEYGLVSVIVILCDHCCIVFCVSAKN